MKFLFLLVLCIYTFLNAPAFNKDKGMLKLEITGLKPIKGFVYISVYNSSKGFPTEGEKAYKSIKIAVHSQSEQVEIPNLDFGKYAISAFHDENSNGKMDVNILGIPKEKYAASNNAKGKFGPPSFTDAAFDFSKNGQAIVLNIH